MVAKRRHVESGYVYHVLNRGALRQQLFQSDQEYSAFETLIEETLARIPLAILTYQLMPNHCYEDAVEKLPPLETVYVLDLHG